MENIQVNGQRIWGPPRDWTGSPPPHGTEIFIKNIPNDVFEIELFQIFSAAGQVYEVRLPVHWSGTNRGYAFVRYTKVSSADAAISNLDMFEVRPGKNIKVERSVDNTRLFLSSVPPLKTGEEIKSDLLTVVDNIKKVYVYPTLEDPKVFRGYAFVEFQCHRDAAIAKRILTPDVCFSLFDKKCVAAWANPLPYLEETILQNLNILFMRNVPKELNGITVKKILEALIGPGEVRKVKRLNDFAFLTFKNHESAKKAMNVLRGNPFLLGGNEILIEWAVPREMTNGGTGVTEKGCEVDSNTQRKATNLISKTSPSPVIKYPGPIKIQSDKKTPHLNTTDYVKVSKPITIVENSKPRKILPNSQATFKLTVGTSTIQKFQQSTNESESNKNLYSFLDKFENLNVSPSVRTPLEILPTYNSGNVYDIVSPKDSEDPEGIVHYQDMSPDSEMGSHGSEESYRSTHSKHWLASRIFPSCPSPSLTNSSADSLTLPGWNFDESNRVLARTQPSMEYDSSINLGYSSMNRQIVPMFSQFPNFI